MAIVCVGDKNFETFDFDSVVTIKNFISRGAVGDVYGPFIQNSRKCALKRIWSSDDNRGDVLKREVETKGSIWTSMKHKNLIEIFCVVLEPKSLLIVMEFASGGSLRSLLKKCDVTVHSQIDVSNWARQTAEGMLFMHQRNVVHRDLKSDNIILKEPFDSSNAHKEMTLKITDFDEVKELNHTTTMSFIGTHVYMAPEVLLRHRFSKASDVWSYGCVVLEMLTRNRPHTDLLLEGLVEKAQAGQLALPIPESIPEAYKRLLCDCWCQNTNSRPDFRKIVDQLSDIDSSGGCKQKCLNLEKKLEPVQIKKDPFQEQIQGLNGIHGRITNDDMKNRIFEIYAEFISNVDPDLLGDYLKQENIVSIDCWETITAQKFSAKEKCRAVVDYLRNCDHPSAFLVIRKALEKDDHYILKVIDKTGR